MHCIHWIKSSHQDLVNKKKDLVIMRSFLVITRYNEKRNLLNPKSMGMMVPSQSLCYHHLPGLRHWKIRAFLKTEDGVYISMSTLRRQHKSLGLLSREARSDVLDVALFLQERLNHHGIFMDTSSYMYSGSVATQKTVRHQLTNLIIRDLFL